MLSSNFKYKRLLNHFENNKDKKWYEWLEFEKILDKPGKQGIVGMFKMKNEKLDKKSKKDNKTEDEPRYIFKISQNINFLAYHELTVMQGLNEVSQFCPHFCKGIGLIKADTEPTRKSKNPFNIKSKYPVEKELLLCEYIEKSSKFCNYIRNTNINEDVLYSIMKQVLMGINIAQKITKFTHYDLHSNNVMIKKCYKDLVFVYKLDDDNQFCVPTFGYYPIIIDYGFSYISDMEDGPLWTSLAHTEVGFMSDRFDWVADPKLFLITVSDEIKCKRGTRKAKKLRRIVRNIFAPLKIDVESGWDNVENKGAVDYVLEIFETCNNKSKIFEDYDYYCIDILQSLIILPLEEQDYSDIENIFQIFLNEWVKIENEISNEFYNLYILKEIVNIAREVRSLYMKTETKDIAINKFRQKVYEATEKVAKFCIPKNLHFEKFLCSLLILAQNIEGILYDIITSRMKVKQKEYDKMPLENLDQIYAALDVNLRDEYKYNNKTIFYIIDMVNKNNDFFEIPKDEINNINQLNNISRGCYVYDLYKNK
jgi:hypothetical protein